MDRSMGKDRASRKQRLGEAARKAKPARAGGRGRIQRIVKARGSVVPVPANDTEVVQPNEMLLEEAALDTEVLAAGMDMPAEEAAGASAATDSVELEPADDVSSEADDTEVEAEAEDGDEIVASE